MEHSKGKVEIFADELIFPIILDTCHISDKRMATFAKCEDAERCGKLWNAADGLTTAEAVKYITHGPEMEEELKNHCEECEVHIKHAEATMANCPFCPTRDLLAKLNKEGA